MSDDAMTAKRRLRIDGQRRGLSIALIMYAVALFVACGMLLCIRMPEPLYWTNFAFWRIGMTAFGIVVLAVMHDFVVRTCSVCEAQSVAAIVVALIYTIWSLIVAGFVVHDIINCSSRVWCASTTSIPHGYYLTWIIAFFLMLLFQVIMILLAVRLRSELDASGVCGTSACEKETRRSFVDTASFESEMNGDPALVFGESLLASLRADKSL